MFICNRKIRRLIFLTCVIVMTAHPVTRAAQTPAGTVSLRFTNADMYEFADRMSEILGLTPLMVDPSVQGTVDINFPAPRDEVFSLFNGILKSKNAALVRQDNIYQIVPTASAIRNNLEIIEDSPATTTGEISPAPPGRKRAPEDTRTIPVATHVIRLDFVPVEDIVEAVRLFVSDGIPIITFKRLNLMIITDYSDNAARVRELVRMLDSSYLDADLVELIKIENSNVLDVADELKKIFASSAGDNAATGVSFVPFERLNSIFVVAGTKMGLNTAKRWIEELDTNAGGKYQTFVYTIQDSTASNIAAMLLALYGDEGSSSGSSSGSNRSTQRSSRTPLGTSSTRSLIDQALGGDNSTFGSAQQLGPRLNTNESSISSIILRGGEFSNLRDEARVVVDDINNVLHIQSTLADYRSLLSAIEKMDVPPRQLRIDAQIFEIDLNNELTYGFRGWMEGRTEGNMTTAGLSNNENYPGLLSLETFAYVGASRQIMLAVDALKTKTKVKILEQPSVFAMDGKQASIVSGAEIPYPGDTVYHNDNISQGVNYRDTGVSLIVIPRISASGSVTLEISQEVSTVSNQTVGGVSAAVFPKSSVETTLMVKDGETVAIAGLIRDRDTWGRAGIPFLSSIPFIGGLFGATTGANTRTELIILITPHIIRTPDRFRDVTEGLRDSLRNVSKQISDYESNRIRDIEESRQYREKKELKDMEKSKKQQR